MEFCPKCGSVLFPGKVGPRKKLVCHRCGYKGKIKRHAPYKISEKGKEFTEIPVMVGKKKKRKPIEREYEIEPPEYYEEFYEPG